MTSAEFEVLFCDYLDGLLRDPEKAALEQHLNSCAACGQLAQDIRAAMAFVATAERVDPPAELLTRILHEIPAAKPKPERRSWLRRVVGGVTDGLAFRVDLLPPHEIDLIYPWFAFA
jgi:anti-sigma factor RsiW